MRRPVSVKTVFFIRSFLGLSRAASVAILPSALRSPTTCAAGPTTCVPRQRPLASWHFSLRARPASIPSAARARIAVRRICALAPLKCESPSGPADVAIRGGEPKAVR
jgi:hypothetical protein